MPQIFGTTIDMFLELGQDAIIGAMVLSVLVAALTAGAYLWLRRGKSDVTAVLVGLIVITNLACLTTGAAFVRSQSRSRNPSRRRVAGGRRSPRHSAAPAGTPGRGGGRPVPVAPAPTGSWTARKSRPRPISERTSARCSGRDGWVRRDGRQCGVKDFVRQVRSIRSGRRNRSGGSAPRPAR